MFALKGIFFFMLFCCCFLLVAMFICVCIYVLLFLMHSFLMVILFVLLVPVTHRNNGYCLCEYVNASTEIGDLDHSGSSVHSVSGMAASCCWLLGFFNGSVGGLRFCQGTGAVFSLKQPSLWAQVVGCSVHVCTFILALS